MRAIWCWVEAKTLSDRALKRPAPERTARVWQSTDLLHPSAPGAGFVKQAWKVGAAPAFDLQVVRTWPEASPAFDSETAFESPLPLESLPAPDMAADPLVPTSAMSEAALETIRQQAHAQGLAEGRQQMREEMMALQSGEQLCSQALLTELDGAVRALIDTPERLFEPLKRLALHLAEQLVLAELSVSAAAVERLVQRCVEELAPQRNTPVLVELNPADLILLDKLMRQKASPADKAAGSADVRGDGDAKKSATSGDNPHDAAALSWQLQANEDLLPGSVRASASDTGVSDLIENRLDAMARALLLDPVRGMAQSAFQPDRLATRLPGSRQVVDAQPPHGGGSAR
jgi:flagellar biosynthesis/type III secretory pathway protein FliH